MLYETVLALGSPAFLCILGSRMFFNLKEAGEHGDHDHDGHGETEGEGGHASDPESPTYTYNGTSTTLGSRGGETPPPPPTPPNGDTTPVQLKHLPDGDAPSAALKAEGFMDSSESPLKV